MEGTGPEKGGSGTGQCWLKLSVPAPPIMEEALTDLLAAESGNGVEVTPVREGSLIVSGFFPVRKSDQEILLRRLESRLEELFALYGLSLPALSQRLLEDEDWATSWQRYFQPMHIVDGLVVRPSWERYTPADHERVIEMDPGQAFGTGQHASTRLALELVRDLLSDLPAPRVLDVGTGTGILAMAAALFGAASVLALDNDPEAVRVARENTIRNRLSDRVRVSDQEVADLEESFDLVVANIVHDVLAALAPDLVRVLAPGGRLVLAGILAGEQVESLTDLYGRFGMQYEQERRQGEWSALLLVR